MNTAPGAMKDEDIAKYNKAYPPMKPKHGRFSPDGQFFLCESVSEIEKLEALGWNTNPFDHDPPYKPEKARWVEKWDDINFEGKAPEPVVSGAESSMAAELAKLRAENEALRAAAFSESAKPQLAAMAPRAVGRPKKAA